MIEAITIIMKRPKAEEVVKIRKIKIGLNECRLDERIADLSCRNYSAYYHVAKDYTIERNDDR